MIPFGKRIELGTLFDDLADRRGSTTVHVSRPLDIAPGLGTALDPPALARLVRAASGWLAAAGAGRGDRIAIAKRDHWDTVLLCCAAARIGAVPAPLSAHLDAGTLDTLLGRLGPALLVTDSARLAASWTAGGAPESRAARTLLLDGDSATALTLDDVRGAPVPAPYRPPVDHPLAIMHTSGTTGVPKLVTHTTRTLLRRLAGFEAHRWPLLSARPDDVLAGSFSFVHGRALAWTAVALTHGPREILAIPSSDWAEAGPLLDRHRPTVVEAQPATFVRWRSRARHDDHPFDRVRLFISTFDAVHPPTVRTFLRATRHPRPVWLQGWGQSETGPLTFRFLTRRALAAERERHPTTRDLGRPVPGRTRLRVLDRVTLRPVPRGAPGLVVCATKAIADGYVGERSRFERKRAGRWFMTGDIGVRTRDGRLLLLDREADAVPEGSGAELEDVLEDRLPDVAECVVLSVPGGPSLPVVVTDADLDPDAWREATADLPELAAPIAVKWDGVPRTGTGKVRRGALRERLGLAPDTYGTGRWT
ncbi:class I adenylate-forming enzyme family protein [Actinomadura algeriensis]|uniref:Acyl-coenzyme A synthetase/AMP-(Fatty) acid ligase n=1 Tax=Actinomadura algeriensis TaxID=1679523 RepID=A0ABR9JQX6_9ACTN|nr:class I adenylate-forming enzyme family protein [Actinomadura algeriensis]MBE1532829.1 acyl-coenzyme A synthetase/AMP-(fatty) acid ligase [Actinomadura algeriensis]